ncbi:serine O-acetyltransferase [Subtercola boreus]|uniref:serine O-acetyltransferase n=1 Tax=Subtercola boreus TaxID=120213 RepID=UPI0015598223|nr:serine acetyltransferase [Subtercola boreus]
MSQSELPNAIRSRQDYLRFLEWDLRAHGLNRWRFYLVPQYPELHYQRVLRRTEYLRTLPGIVGKIRYSIQRVRLARLSVHTGISIPPGVFGPGLSIAHFGSIVVNDRARVGAWCRIHSGTNIGVNRGGVPELGSHVYIGPGAVLFGAITVGDSVVVGANAVVTEDVPSSVTVAGAPAKVIAERGSASSMPEWFPPYSS